MEQPQTIGDEHQPEVEWDPPPTLGEKYTAHEQHIMNLANKPMTDLEHLNDVYKRRIAELEPDAALGALLHHLPENSSLIHTSAITSPQDPYEWTVIVGDYNKPDYYTNGNTPEEALRNLFQCMAGES